MILNKTEKAILSIERACNDLRKGFAVIVKSGNNKILVTSPEVILPPLLAKLNDYRLVISPQRASYITGNEFNNAASITITDQDNIADIAGVSNKPYLHEAENLTNSKKIDLYALKLTKIAELIPAAIICDEFEDDGIFLTVTDNQIDEYKNNIEYGITEACRTDISLKNAEDAQIIAYRPTLGGKEHYAIIIGKKTPKEPLVRIHSSCYTGDLLDSLECDCHDQLHEAINLMQKKGGGIILYMLQEGRGIGLINKLRAYALKSCGMDTVEANEALGFNDDERDFLPAAQILKTMGIKKLQLLSNNPRKAKGLEDLGIKVTKCVPHVIEHNKHNKKYLETKFTRLGHKK